MWPLTAVILVTLSMDITLGLARLMGLQQLGVRRHHSVKVRDSTRRLEVCKCNEYEFFTASVQAITCLDLPQLSNGVVAYDNDKANGRPVGTLVTYSCNPGYTLNGDTIRICRSDGTWSGSEPTCEGK